MSNVEPEEAEAIMDLMNEPAAGAGRSEVQERDFSSPRRLSRSSSGEILQRLKTALPAISAGLTHTLGETTKIDVSGIRETNAESLVVKAPRPLTAVRFVIGGQPGWMTWTNASALIALNRILSASEEEGSARKLTRVENRVLKDLLASVLVPACRALGLEPSELRVVSEDHEIGDWKSGEPDHADYHRVAIDFETEGALELGTISAYLPGLQFGAATTAGKDAPAKVPGHLNSIELDVHAQLGTTKIALADLLALENGDVVPLDVSTHSPIRIIVQDQLCGEGVLGRSHGKIAVRITNVSLPPTASEPKP